MSKNKKVVALKFSGIGFGNVDFKLKVA